MSVLNPLRDWPLLLAASLDRWTLRQHRPLDIDGEAVCHHCETGWPCDEWVKADARLRP